jgi:hypothetical protein
MYDFMVLGYYASAIGNAFSPAAAHLLVVRTSAFALAYSLATAIFGGFTPVICTYLIHATHNLAVPGLWLSFAAVCGLTATLFTRPSHALLRSRR